MSAEEIIDVNKFEKRMLDEIKKCVNNVKQIKKQ